MPSKPSLTPFALDRVRCPGGSLKASKPPGPRGPWAGGGRPPREGRLSSSLTDPGTVQPSGSARGDGASWAPRAVGPRAGHRRGAGRNVGAAFAVTRAMSAACRSVHGDGRFGMELPPALTLPWTQGAPSHGPAPAAPPGHPPAWAAPEGDAARAPRARRRRRAWVRGTASRRGRLAPHGGGGVVRNVVPRANPRGNRTPRSPRESRAFCH